MIDLTRINAQQAERNRKFMAWVRSLNAEFETAKFDAVTIEPYYPDENNDFDVQPVQAHVTDPTAGSGVYGLVYRHAQEWKDLNAAVSLIRWRISVT